MALPQLLGMCLLLAGTHGLDNGDMRLVDGGEDNQGRVEIFYRGQWGTVCDNNWDLIDAGVVCRALGFQNATQALGGAAFGQGRGPVMLDKVQCTGTELSLAQCRSLGWLQSRCGHEKDASVVCTNETGSDPVVYTLDLSSELGEVLGGIFDSQQSCDLAIQVHAGGKEVLQVCAHTLILSSNPEAQVLLRGTGSSVTIAVDTECLPVVSEFIRYLYSRRLDVTLSSVKCFHLLASTHGAQQLQDYCAHLFAVLLPQDPSFRTTLDLHAYAQATSDTLLAALCEQFLAWNLEALTQSEAWPSVPPALLRSLLSRSDLAVSSERALLMAVDLWGQETRTSRSVMAGLLQDIRFPMILPSDLFELQFNLSLLRRHGAFFQEKVQQALEFHTVPLQLLVRHWGLNLTQDAYQPRLYTAPTWSGSVSGSRQVSQKADPYSSTYYYGRSYTQAPSAYGYYPSVSFWTPQHPSFLFQSTRLSWSLFYLPTVQSCWNYGFSCSSDELPALGLTSSSYPNQAIGYENKALVLCSGNIVVGVTDFKDKKAPIPHAQGNSSNASFFPCPVGFSSSFRAAIRPFYLTNSSDIY
ncbi:PREDICTED: galectin-3-binding protein [Chrysochloris asiatica]|uniref:Galectin-3-binding protein n=1 Tax=Chrysochloris asiatica TaxID=185453 RepID=A0A9B0TVY3_CHRAS|nr:PREDICTED: galectin-3-binding protein [Chrysochloris asiatica]